MYTDAFARRSLCTEELLHGSAYIHRTFGAKTPSDKATFFTVTLQGCNFHSLFDIVAREVFLNLEVYICDFWNRFAQPEIFPASVNFDGGSDGERRREINFKISFSENCSLDRVSLIRHVASR